MINTAIIIGGGIAGPVAALALHKAGIEATVYESYANTADGLGGTIGLAPNGVAALEIVAAAAATVAAAEPAYRQVMRVGRKRIEVPGLRDVGALQVVRRSDLYRVLHERTAAEGISIVHGKRLVDVREGADSITAVFADGGEATADVLIGADGVHSTVRRLIDPAAPGPRYTGMLSFEAVSAARVPDELGTMSFAFGGKAYYLYWPTTAGGTRIGFNLPYGKPLSIAEARDVPAEQWMRTLTDVYGEDDPGGALIRGITPAELQINGALFIMPPVPHWHRGRMVLVGDAAHAPSNSSGQGASLSIESAVQLARSLRDCPSVPEAFAAYESLRRDRVERVAARAAKINHTKAPGPAGQALMRILMPVFMHLMMRNAEKTIGVEQRYRIDWEAGLVRDNHR